jgi:ribonuclease P protein component
MSPEDSSRLRLPRQRRITRGSDFHRVRGRGRRLVRGCLIANWLATPEKTVSRLGVITSGKIGGAVIRTRARRLLREAFRLHQHELGTPVDLVLVARSGIVRMGLAGVEKDFLTAMADARLLKAQK